MASTILRGVNSTNVPLLANGIFLGGSEFAGSLLTVLVNCYADTEIKVEVFEYATPALTVAVPISTTTIPALTYQQVQVNLSFPYVKLVVTNMAATAQNQLDINTVYTNLLPLGGGLFDGSGNVAVTVSNLITETLATRRVDFLVVGTWYRVASVGITTGAEWNAIGAIVDGESVPVIGRLFKCLQVGPAVQNGGECYDVEYTDDVSASVTNLITETLATRRVDFLVVGDYYRVASVGITTGAQWNQIGAIVGGESAPVIGRLFKCLQVGPAVAGGGTCYDVEYTDDVSATVTNFPAVQAVSGTVSLTDPTTVRIRDTYGDPIVTTAGNLMVGIGNIYTANPLHVIVDSVTPPTTAVAGALAVSTTGITLKASAGKLLTLHINSDGALGTNYVKIYNEAVPTSASTPIFTIGVLFGSSQNVDCSSLSFATAIGVRATTAAAAGDNTPPTNTINVTAFFV
jgi:hypothetical protein